MKSNPFIHETVAARLKALQPFIVEQKLEAYRLLEQSPLLPCAVDIYGENAVIHLFDDVYDETLKELEEAITAQLKIVDFFYKDRTKLNILLRQNPAVPHKEIVVKENGHSFLINLTDYQDVGLFLDHRETRAWIGEHSRGKVVLNMFAYTGSFSIYAAAAGATKTYSVDLSRTYCEWIKKNLALNNLPLEQNWTYKMDAAEFLRYAKRKNLIFDIIIIDPPTFSRSKAGTFSVQKDHPALLQAALAVLAPDGFILFSNNYTGFVIDEQKLPGVEIEEKVGTVPPDFFGTQPHQCYILKSDGGTN